MGRRGERSRDSRHYYDWIEAALQDRLAAELLITDERLYDSCDLDRSVGIPAAE